MPSAQYYQCGTELKLRRRKRMHDGLVCGLHARSATARQRNKAMSPVLGYLRHVLGSHYVAVAAIMRWLSQLTGHHDIGDLPRPLLG